MFKVGDLIVRKQKYAFSCVVKIKEIREHSKNVFIDYEDAKGKGWGDLLKYFRHATPEEIKLGHRVEQVNNNETN
ncbi:hypothetical protein [Acinetobacter sp. 'aerobic (ED)']|uniref:hypothetical protein n=1 Tax=Acinetobacter sp. 'aerobic (ED)' TaxID=174230 RepID=UPI00192BED10|nr:hypothetical protein [Acinetobacter sp. 'aerobic (ED)']